MSELLASYPAFNVISVPEEADLQLTHDKGYVRVFPFAVRVKRLARDKYDYIRSYTIGCDGDNADNVFAFGNASVLSSYQESGKDVCVGVELGQILKIEGKSFKIQEDFNNNIKLVRV